ncbi:MAG TPA: hypothetical protein VNF50_00015 [Acidimicrobiales bacterium]|nr:hypothetical protein [Acidimicrobiales bacterium]
MAQKPLSPAGGEADRIALRVPTGQRSRLTRAALRRGCSMSEVIRLALDALLAEEEALSA